MPGQIIKLGKGKYRVRVQWRDSNAPIPPGKTRAPMRSVSQLVYGSRDEAREVREELLRAHTTAHLRPAVYTLDEWLDLWLAATRKRIRPNTARFYEEILTHYIRPALGGYELSTLTAPVLQKVFNAFTLAPKTQLHIRNTLATALNHAIAQGVLPSNPCRLLILPRQRRVEVAVLSANESRRYYELCRASGNRYGVILAFALLTGMRPSEYLALRWADVTLTGDVPTARVTRSVRARRKGGGFDFDETKTTRGRRPVSFPRSLAAWLVEHRRAQGERRLALGSAWQNHDLIFPSEIGTPLAQKNLVFWGHRKILALDKSLPQKVTLYALRHTHATLLLLANENPKVVSERLGHASVSITLDTYSHLIPSLQASVAARLETLFDTGHSGDTHTILEAERKTAASD